MREGVAGTEAFMVLYGGANTSFTTCVGILQRLVWHHDHHNGQPIEAAIHQYLIWVEPFMKITDKRTIEMTESGAYWLLGKKRPSVVKAHKKDEYSLGFSSFWEVFPNKKAKQEAWRAWQQMEAFRPSDDQICAAVNRQLQGESWTSDGGKWIPHPASWLRSGRWDDEVKMNNGATVRYVRPDDKL